MSLFPDTKDGPNSEAFFDQWSLLHFSTGFVFAAAFDRLFPGRSIVAVGVLWLLLHTLYEIKDFYGYQNETKEQIEEQGGTAFGSPINSIGDTIITVLGFSLYFLIRNKIKTETRKQN